MVTVGIGTSPHPMSGSRGREGGGRRDRGGREREEVSNENCNDNIYGTEWLNLTLSINKYLFIIILNFVLAISRKFFNKSIEGIIIFD